MSIASRNSTEAKAQSPWSRYGNRGSREAPSLLLPEGALDQYLLEKGGGGGGVEGAVL